MFLSTFDTINVQQNDTVGDCHSASSDKSQSDSKELNDNVHF